MFLIVSTGNCIAEELKDDALMIKECSQEASNYFNSMYGKYEKIDNGGTSNISKFKVHYNKQNNKCYIVSSVNLFSTKAKFNYYFEELTDVKEKILIGSYIINFHTNELVYCTVDSIECRSKLEFEKLLRPYMSPEHIQAR